MSENRSVPATQFSKPIPSAVRVGLFLIMLLVAAVARTDPNAPELENKSRIAEELYNRGYIVSLLGHYERAITQAKVAIRIDPDFGNPYNDIGVYLIELGRDGEAISYLEKAIGAKRYCCYQFPHFNLGRIYLKKKMYVEAREEFGKSLIIDSTYLPTKEALELLEQAGIKGI